MNHRHPRLLQSARAWALAAVGLSLGCAPTPATPPAQTAAAPAQAPAAPPAPALPGPDLPADQRAEALLKLMTLEEKIDYIGGDRDFYIRAVPRLKIPEIKMADGPAGVRNWGPSTAYPGALGLAGTFDPELIQRVGGSIGRDGRARGVHILLAPGVNIHRSPVNGRNFEYMGEDPWLSGTMASAYIRGVQSEGLLATVKHFAGNNQEWDRNHISSEIDERTLREIYFPAFERAVREGQVGAVMTAYNLLNGIYCSHNEWLLHQVLKKEWGFSGIVMSDWEAVHDTLGAANGGCDLEMPSAKYMNRALLMPLIEQQKVQVATLDDKVRRILRTLIAAGFLDRTQKRDDIPSDDPKSAAIALEAAQKSLVLLKNRANLLPLDGATIKRIAVIGPNAQPLVYGGSGSAFVTAVHTVNLIDGLKQVAPNVEVSYHPGVQTVRAESLLGQAVFTGPVREELFANKTLAGQPVRTREVDRIDFQPKDKAPAEGVGSTDYSIRWTGTLSVDKPGKYQLLTNADDGIRVAVDGKVVIEAWTDRSPTTDSATLELTPGPHAVVVEYYQSRLGAVAQLGFAPFGSTEKSIGAAEVSKLAREADVVILSVGYGQNAETNSGKAKFEGFWPPGWARKANLVESEDSDRKFELPAEQLETIRLAGAANSRTVVVMNAGGGVEMQGFLPRVAALLWAFYPGQEGGRAVADVLFGQVNPSGKLPVTFARRYADYPSAPYYQLNQNGKTPYTEGVFVGYRGFDQKKLTPEFPFGFGLSYTKYTYSNLKATGGGEGAVTVTLDVKNSGSRAGEEVVQFYVAPPASSAQRPPKELKGFARVALAPGETKTVTVTLEPRAFAYWDTRSNGWTVEAGKFQVLAAASSRDVRATVPVELAARSLPR